MNDRSMLEDMAAESDMAAEAAFEATEDPFYVNDEGNSFVSVDVLRALVASIAIVALETNNEDILLAKMSFYLKAMCDRATGTTMLSKMIESSGEF